MMNGNVFIAAKDGNIDAIKKLHGQNPCQLKEVTYEDNTALHIAAREGHLEVVKWILQNVKDCCMSRARNADLNTPLHEAAKRGNADIIRTLLRYNKCAASKRNQFGESALLIASEHGHVEAVRVLVEATPLYIIIWPRENHQTCLHVAAYGGHLVIVKLILQRPSFCNILHLIVLMRDVHGCTPLHSAVHGGNANIVREIANTKFSCRLCINWFDKRLMTKKDMFGRCAVHLAAIKGDQEMIDNFLSEMPYCTEIRSRDLKTALHFAVENNQFEIVKKLLPQDKIEEMAELVRYDRDISGNTLLHLAIINGGDPELVEYILPFVNVNAINNDGLRAIDKAPLATFQNEPCFTKITWIVEEAGGSRSFIGNSRHSNSVDFKQESNGIHKIMDVDTLVASLIATITFAAIFTVPGGTYNNDSGTGGKSARAATAHGHSGDVSTNNGIARLTLNTLFQVFLFSDSLAMFASLTVVIAWLFRERLQTKLIADRSLLANLTVVSLGTSVVSTGLAFLSATILITIPPSKYADVENSGKYRLLFWGEILTAFSAPALSLIFLSTLWTIEYHFKATVEFRARLRKQLKEALIYIIPPFAIVLGIIIGIPSPN
ncbi:ankyrin repeat-containing protein NPR4 [Cryptomeria japonica]|uniref:ankyrin repeat-containing protein NPR4 n=1 Tax=Cryptomeria japonica TaxID=3369 RepID=UPI0025AC21B4|nr:ankyrin repeat-containing protein NPR4 [Cryptomeria japonica]